MIKFLWKSFLVTILILIVALALRALVRIVGPDVEPFWAKARDAVREHGFGWKKAPVFETEPVSRKAA